MKNQSNRNIVSFRETFSQKDKKVILTKSNGKCAHCGKELDVSQTTVEHVIPFSKGGSNNVTNLVALCEECNKDKSNTLVKPQQYYKHLKKEYLDQLTKNFEKFQEKDKNWFDFQTFFPRDEFRIPNYVPIIAVLSKSKKNYKTFKFDFFKQYKQQALQYGHYTFKRARFKDMPNLINFFEYQYNHHKLNNFTKDNVKDRFKEKIKSALLNGAVFYIKNGKDISGVYIFRISACSIYGEATFSITMESSFKSNALNTCIMSDYINNELITGLFCNNDFKYILMTSYYDENDVRLNSAYSRLINDQDTVLMSSDEEKVISEMVMYERKSNDIDSKRLKRTDIDKKNLSQIEQLPKELGKDSEFFKKIVEMSSLDDEDVRKFLKINEEIKKENIQSAKDYELKRDELLENLKELKKQNNRKAMEQINKELEKIDEIDHKIGVAMLGSLAKKEKCIV